MKVVTERLKISGDRTIEHLEQSKLEMISKSILMRPYLRVLVLTRLSALSQSLPLLRNVSILTVYVTASLQ